MDTVGGKTLEQSIDVVKPNGTIVSIIPTNDGSIIAKAKEHNVNLTFWGMRPNVDDLKSIADLVSEGKIKPHIAKVYPFNSMVEAHKQVETRRTTGKIVLTVLA